VLSLDNTCLVTGGDDTIVRVYKMTRDFKEKSSPIELIGATQAITGVDISKDNTRVIASCKDGNTYIFNLQTKQIIDRLCFKCRPDTKNMLMRACAFRDDGCAYTLCT